MVNMMSLINVLLQILIIKRKWDKGLDVAIVYFDDESYKFLSKTFSYPYPRGKVWAKE